MYSKTFIAGCVVLVFAGVAAAQGVAPGNPARDAVAPGPGSGTLKDAVVLCERLAGTEREICLQQARENRERALAPGVGATPGEGAARAPVEQPRPSSPR